MLAKTVNDNASFLRERGAYWFFASKLAPTGLGSPRLQWVLEGDGFAACERVRQGAAVHQFQLATQRYAMGDP